MSYFPQAAPAACRVCPGEGFRGPVDQSLLGPPQAAHSSPSEASATDSGSPQAPAVDCNSVHAMTGACSEAEDDSGDTALRPKGDNVARSTWMFMLPALPTQYISRFEDLLHVPAGDMYVQTALPLWAAQRTWCRLQQMWDATSLWACCLSWPVCPRTWT